MVLNSALPDALVGREREAEEVARRLGTRRLVTIVGPGGIGKTTLARHVAHEMGLGGAVDLTSIANDEAVAGAIASQLGHSSFETLIASPAPEQLIMLDNCEHVLAGAALAVDRLIQTDPGWRFLATSRSALNLTDESIVALGPLSTPEAVALFLARARDAGVDIGPAQPDALGTVSELCRRLDGVPLAIEIAAARTRGMTPAMILDHLRAGVDVLERPRYRGPRRHRSVRDTIGWSYALLDDAQRRALDRLSVCAGPFDLELAAAVVDVAEDANVQVLEPFDGLVEASLIAVDAFSPTPYRLLETIRSFALERLQQSGQQDPTVDRFVDHVVHTVLTIMERGRAGWNADVLHELLMKYDNIAAALTSCLERDADPTRSLLLCSVLWGVVHNGHVDDVAQLSEQTLRRWPDPEEPLWPDAIASYATATLLLGDVQEAVELAESALPHAGAAAFASATLRRLLGLAAQAVANFDRAETLFAEVATAARESGAGAMAMEADVLRAQALSLAGRRDEALSLVRTSRLEAEAGGWHINSVFATLVEGLILATSDAEMAMSCLTDALEVSRESHYPYGVTAGLQSIAYLQLRQGHESAAAATIVQLVDEMGGSPSDWSRADPLGPVAALMYVRGLDGWEDIAATSRWRARTTPLPAAGLHLLSSPGDRGRVLPARQATDIMLAVLESVVEWATSGSSGDSAGSQQRPTAASFTLEGEMWTVSYVGKSVHLKSSKGMHDLAQLLSRPGSEISCLDLVGATIDDRSTGEVIDSAARRRYEERLHELQSDIDSAESHDDHVSAERAQTEFDAIVDHLTAALGVAGRSRRQVDTTERARSAVTQRIRATIKRIGSVHPQLGAHLLSAVNTGMFCSYRPEIAVKWSVRTHSVTPDLTPSE